MVTAETYSSKKGFGEKILELPDVVSLSYYARFFNMP
jgi:hypothetical protein